MRAAINLTVRAEELLGMGSVYDAYFGVANEMFKVVMDTEEEIIDFSVVEQIKLALGMTVTKAESVTLDNGAVINWEYKVNKEEVSMQGSIEAYMAVYGPLFAAYTDVINTYGNVLVNTVKELRPLVLSAIEIKDRTRAELEVATSNLQIRHSILKGGKA